MLEKELPKKIDESTKHGGTNRPTQWQVDPTADGQQNAHHGGKQWMQK